MVHSLPSETKGMGTHSSILGASLLAQTVKNLPAMWETWVWSLHQEDPLEKGIATHSSILAWRIPMDRGALAGCSPWSHKQLDTTEQLNNNNISTLEHIYVFLIFCVMTQEGYKSLLCASDMMAVKRGKISLIEPCGDPATSSQNTIFTWKNDCKEN